MEPTITPQAPPYQLLIEALPEAVLVLNQEGVVTYVNQAAVDLLARPPEELLGSQFGIPGAESETGVVQLIAQQGAPFTLRMSARRVDISPEFCYVAALHPVDDRFRPVGDEIPGLLWVTDATGCMTYLNRRFFEFTGQQRRGPLAESWASALHPDERTLVQKKLLDAHRKISEFRLEHRLLGGDGRYHWVVNSGHPWRATDGQFLGFAGAVIDISDQKLAEESAARTAARINSILETAPDGILTFDISGAINSMNMAAASMFGLQPGSTDGASISQLIVQADDEVCRHPRRDEIDVDQLASNPHQRYCGRRSDGSLFPVEMSVSKMQQGAEKLYTAVLRDVTMRAQMEEEIRQQAEALLRADRRKDEIIAMLAHELRNPLAPILTSIAIIESLPMPPTISRQLDMIHRQVLHMKRHLDDLLDVSRLSRGKIILERETIDLCSHLRDLVEMLGGAASEAGLEIRLQLPDDPVFIWADPARIHQVFFNLIQNSLKYTPSGGKVEIEAVCTADTVEVCVRDTGRGIDPAMIEEVFDLFTQEESSLDRTGQGLGIGLSVVKSLVTQHGGDVSARSDGPGMGSCFAVRLPLSRGDQQPQAAAAPEAGRTAPGDTGAECSLTVLVVDDNRDAADSLAELLQIWGHRTITAYGGQQAIDLTERLKPDVLILDIGMPGLNGYEVAKRLRSSMDGSRPTLLALTGYGRTEDVERSRDAGFDGHLVKPVDAAAVRSCLSQAGSAAIKSG